MILFCVNIEAFSELLYAMGSFQTSYLQLLNLILADILESCRYMWRMEMWYED